MKYATIHIYNSLGYCCETNIVYSEEELQERLAYWSYRNYPQRNGSSLFNCVHVS